MGLNLNSKDKKARILIIDDIKDVWESYKSTLEDENIYGFQKVDHEVDPRKALDKLKKENDGTDVVLLDLRLPYINGVELLKRIKKINPYIQIIVISAYSTVAEVKEEFESLNLPYSFKKPKEILVDKPVQDYDDLVKKIIKAYYFKKKIENA